MRLAKVYRPRWKFQDRLLEFETLCIRWLRDVYPYILVALMRHLENGDGTNLRIWGNFVHHGFAERVAFREKGQIFYEGKFCANIPVQRGVCIYGLLQTV
jgi:hypothetical protein